MVLILVIGFLHVVYCFSCIQRSCRRFCVYLRHEVDSQQKYADTNSNIQDTHKNKNTIEHGIYLIGYTHICHPYPPSNRPGACNLIAMSDSKFIF